MKKLVWLLWLVGCSWAAPEERAAVRTGAELFTPEHALHQSEADLFTQYDTFVDTGPPNGRGPRLNRWGRCPGPVHIGVNQVRNNARLAYIISPTLGQSNLRSGPCVGLPIGLGSPRKILGFKRAPRGFRGAEFDLPRRFCGKFLQVVDLDRCLTTPIERL